jgi:hypothetical protein
LDKGGKKYFYFANSKTPLSPLFIEKSDKKGGKKEELAPLSRGGDNFFWCTTEILFHAIHIQAKKKKLRLL